MTTRRSIPGVDDQAIVRNADHFPPRGVPGEGEDKRLDPPNPADALMPDKPAKPAKPTEEQATAMPPVALPSDPVRERRRGGFWSFLFMLLALAGAVLAFAAPSLRPIVREAAIRQFGPDPRIDFWTGVRPDFVEIELNKVDQRLATLSAALQALQANPALSRDELRELLLRTPEAERLRALEGTVAATRSAVDGRLATAEQALARATAEVETRLTAATTALEQRLTAADAARAERIAALTTSIEEVKGTAATLTTRAAAGDTRAADLAARIETLTKSLETAAADLATLRTDAGDAAKDALARVEAANGAISELRAAQAKAAEDVAKALEERARREGELTAALTALDGRAGAIETRAGAIEGRLGAVDGRLDGQAKALEDASATLRGELAAATAAAAVTAKAITDRVTAGEQALADTLVRVDDLSRKVEQFGLAGRVEERLLVLAQQLRAVASAGLPFPREAEALTRVAAERPGLAAPLAVVNFHARGGVPSIEELSIEFNEVAPAIISATDDSRGWFSMAQDRVGAFLAGFLGAGNGGVTNAVQTARRRLDEGALAGAIDALSVVPGAPAREAELWLRRARARVELDRAVQRLSAAAVEALATQR